MMYPYFGLPMVFGPLHGIGALLILVGLIFMISYALKHLSPQKIKRYGLWMLGIGVVLVILSVGGRAMSSDFVFKCGTPFPSMMWNNNVRNGAWTTSGTGTEVQPMFEFMREMMEFSKELSEQQNNR